MEKKFFILLVGYLALHYLDASPSPLPLPLDNFSTGKGNSSNGVKDVYAKCNESFKIMPEYLTELNETGSFPDEAEKVPMCFIKCYLEQVGIWFNTSVNTERALELQWIDTPEDVEECLPEMMGDTECEKAYYMTRCIVTRALVDGRGHNSR